MVIVINVCVLVHTIVLRGEGWGNFGSFWMLVASSIPMPRCVLHHTQQGLTESSENCVILFAKSQQITNNDYASPSANVTVVSANDSAASVASIGYDSDSSCGWSRLSLIRWLIIISIGR